MDSTHQAPHPRQHHRISPRCQHHDGIAHLLHRLLERVRPDLRVVLSFVAVKALVLVDGEAVDPKVHARCLVGRQRARKVLQRADQLQSLVGVSVRNEVRRPADEVSCARIGFHPRAQGVRAGRRVGASVRFSALLSGGVIDVVVRVPAVLAVGELRPALRPAWRHRRRQHVRLEEAAGRRLRRDLVAVGKNVLERVEDAGKGDAGAIAVLPRLPRQRSRPLRDGTHP